jgi:lipoate-protein ligase A
MGLEPERAQAYYGDLGEAGPACFDGPSDYEITIGQRKLIGSAQRRQRGVVLQHGSLPLSGDITRICDALALDLGKRMALRNRLHYRATTLASALGQDALDSAEIARALASGFEQALNLTFEPTSLSDAEWALASKLRAERYANDAWTRRR